MFITQCYIPVFHLGRWLLLSELHIIPLLHLTDVMPHACVQTLLGHIWLLLYTPGEGLPDILILAHGSPQS